MRSRLRRLRARVAPTRPRPVAYDCHKWVDHHNEVAAATLLLGTDSWWVGANIPGKPRTLYPYVGGVGTFRAICHEVAEKG